VASWPRQDIKLRGHVREERCKGLPSQVCLKAVTLTMCMENTPNSGDIPGVQHPAITLPRFAFPGDMPCHFPGIKPGLKTPCVPVWVTTVLSDAEAGTQPPIPGQALRFLLSLPNRERQPDSPSEIRFLPCSYLRS